MAMRRTDRLFELIQMLRRARQARGSGVVTAVALADAFGVTPRTIYRDIAELQASGVPVRGEAGVGYRLDAGYDLPPLMFTDVELDAVLLGLRIVAAWGDSGVAGVADQVLAKVRAVVPDQLQRQFDDKALRALAAPIRGGLAIDLGMLRDCVYQRRKLRLDYTDVDGSPSERTVWPLSVVFGGGDWLITCWCELRQDFRNFRLDRVVHCTPTDEIYPDMPGRRLVDYLARLD